MTRLTEQELVDIQSFIDQKIEYAEGMGLELGIDDDMWKWRELMETAPGAVGASRTLDPKLNDVSSGNAFWVKLTDDNGQIIGCQANRFFVTEDFVEEYVCTHRFFGDRCPSLKHYPVQLRDPIPVLCGRMNFGGGGWVHPDWRGKAISGLMSRIGRTLALRHFLIDYYVGFMSATDNHRLYGRHRQGLMNRRHLLSGRYPGREENIDVDIYWMHRGEMMNQISQELAPPPGHTDPATMRTA